MLQLLLYCLAARSHQAFAPILPNRAASSGPPCLRLSPSFISSPAETASPLSQHWLPASPTQPKPQHEQPTTTGTSKGQCRSRNPTRRNNLDNLQATKPEPYRPLRNYRAAAHDAAAPLASHKPQSRNSTGRSPSRCKPHRQAGLSPARSPQAWQPTEAEATPRHGAAAPPAKAPAG